MSRRTFHRYLLFYLSFNAILVYGSSGRIPRHAFCPSCNQDYSEDLVSPWYSHESLNLQKKNLPDFDDTPIENYPYLHTQKETVSQNILRDDSVSSNQDQLLFEKSKNFPQRKTEKWYPETLVEKPFVNKLKQENVFSNEHSNKYSESLDRQRPFLREESANKYPVVPSNWLYSKSGHENSSFRNIRDKYSESSKDRNSEDYPKDEEKPANKILLLYRIDRSPSISEEISEDNSPNNMSLQKSLTLFSQEEESSEIKKSTNSVNQPSYNSANFQEELHYPTGYDISEINHDYLMNTLKPAQEKLLDDWNLNTRKDLSRFSDLEELREIGNDFVRTYPVEEMKMSTKDNDEQCNPYILPQDLTIRELLKDREYFDTWDLATHKDSQEIIKQSKTKDNLLQVYPVLEEDMKSFENKKNADINYLENENRKDMIITKNDTFSRPELNNYNPYSSFENQNIWTIINDTAFLNHRNVTINKDWQETENAKLHAMKENDNKYSYDENRKNVTENNTHSQQMDQVTRTPQINYNPYILSRYLDILNAVNYSADFPNTGISLKVESNTIHSDQKRNETFFKDEILQNDVNQDIALSKNDFNAGKNDGPSTNIQSNKREQDKLLMELDPALVDDIENPLTKSTESILVKSFK